jgi:hypothetical protein
MAVTCSRRITLLLLQMEVFLFSRMFLIRDYHRLGKPVWVAGRVQMGKGLG